MITVHYVTLATDLIWCSWKLRLTWINKTQKQEFKIRTLIGSIGIVTFSHLYFNLTHQYLFHIVEINIGARQKQVKDYFLLF